MIQKETIECPCCESELEYAPVNTTHIWSCSQCPVVMFEYYDEASVTHLQQLLGATSKKLIEQKSLFNYDKMVRLVHREPFLKRCFYQTREFVFNDMKAMEVVFNSYVLGDPVMEKNYEEI